MLHSPSGHLDAHAPADRYPLRHLRPAQEGGKTNQLGHTLWTSLAHHVQPDLCGVAALGQLIVYGTCSFGLPLLEMIRCGTLGLGLQQERAAAQAMLSGTCSVGYECCASRACAMGRSFNSPLLHRWLPLAAQAGR